MLKAGGVTLSSFNIDLSDSIYDFARVVAPKLAELNFISGKLISIESTTNFKGLAKQFDILAGIDIWQIKEKEGIRGIANRIQWGDKAWNTFTIREKRTSGSETEYSKRLRALQTKQWLFPFYTVQSYMTRRRVGELLSLAIAKTEDIFKLIESGNYTKRFNSEDGNSFFCISWRDMEKANLAIKIYERNY